MLGSEYPNENNNTFQNVKLIHCFSIVLLLIGDTYPGNPNKPHS